VSNQTAPFAWVRPLATLATNNPTAITVVRADVKLIVPPASSRSLSFDPATEHGERYPRWRVWFGQLDRLPSGLLDLGNRVGIGRVQIDG
jgi:hypothetical protein